MNQIKSLRSTAKRIYDRLRLTPEFATCHASFAACEALEQAATRVGFEHFGVEGQSNDCGSHGVSYLNAGDPYAQTVAAACSYGSARFVRCDQSTMPRA